MSTPNYNELLLEGPTAGNLHHVKDSVGKGANVNHTDYYGIGALSIASYHGHQQIVEYLIENGANVNIVDRFHFTTPLATAVRSNNVETVKYLLKNGADVNLVGVVDGEKSQPPLTVAIEKENFEMIKLLIENGASIDVEDDNTDNIPLVAAELTKNAKTIDYLRERSHACDFEKQ